MTVTPTQNKRNARGSRRGRRMTARMRAFRRRAAAWRRRARRAAIAALLSVSMAVSSPVTQAQIGSMGQGAMAPGGGVINGAVTRLAELNQNGPGWLYFGLNPADRGLGYRGSYMTLGGFIPYAEDDLGGFWSADLRSHLSVYGGFFSNVGAVRKQFIGGTLLGVGVYWDFDGDQNQYSDTTITDVSGSYLFPGGSTYNQVGVSGEWLTDWGNLRSNGYIPVGSTASIMGPFVGNSLLCVNGINAALGGTDLEVGLYVPGLSDWAGMINVGGYAYGNASYQQVDGTAAVPWFGGVYTRLDMTFLENWDFSIQYNNDSFFDSTGFVRLTYRMGGSRRRNVPDQLEQPMMRNEHIVRAHQAPVQAINPGTGLPWHIIHVDNSVGGGGNGTSQAPVMTLGAAEALASREYDIVFVHQGISQSDPYVTPVGGFEFQAANQYLVGEGSSLTIPTVNCGLTTIYSTTTQAEYPVITNPVGPAIVLGKNSTVDHLSITGSQVGISNGASLDKMATVNDVQIQGTGPNQRGVFIEKKNAADTTVNFSNVTLQNLTNDGVVVASGTWGGNLAVNLTSMSISDTTGSALVVDGVGGDGRVRLVDSTLSGATGPLIQVSDGNAIVSSSKLVNKGNYGVLVTGISTVSGTSTVQINDSTIDAAVGIQGSAPDVGDVLNLTFTENTMRGVNGISLASGTAGGTINANMVGNKISTVGITSGTSSLPGEDIVLGVNGSGSIQIRALNELNLSALNDSANITTTGTATYDPALVVPLPAP